MLDIKYLSKSWFSDVCSFVKFIQHKISDSMVYSLPILWKKIFSYGPHIKNTPLWIFVSYKPLKGDQAGVSLDFDQLWEGEVLCQIWCFIQNLHYALKIFVVMLLNITPCCSRLRLRIAYFIYFKFTRVSLIVYQSLYY